MIPQWSRFLAAAGRPEPDFLRVRTGRIGVDELRRLLEAQGFVVEPVEGLPAFLRVADGPYPPGQTLEHWLGLFYVQQAATGVAALALKPRAEERILDACAAPGGKTGHLADLMGDTGTVVSVDVSEKRLRALLGNVYRTAHLNVLGMSADARHLPKSPVLFDRVLVDVPCTAEGNLRAKDGEISGSDPSFREYISGVQEEILRRALALTRPGGTVLYCTCTFAPEENEAVVSRVLRDAPARVEPIDLDLPHAPGLTRFEAASFDPSLEQAWRLYPHHQDSGGLFMARLRRLDGDEAEDAGGWAAVPEVFPGDSASGEEARERVESCLEILTSEFGVDREAVRDVRWIVRGDSVWVHRAEEFPVGWAEVRDRRFLSLGLRAFKEDPRSPGGERPTNDLLKWLDARVTRRVLPMDSAGCLELLRGGQVAFSEASHGFVALRVDGRTVGRGRIGRGGVRPEIPKAHARRLQDVLALRTESTAS